MLHGRKSTQLSILVATCVLTSLALAADETPAAPKPVKTPIERLKQPMDLGDMMHLADEIKKTYQLGESPTSELRDSTGGESGLFMYRVLLIVLFSLFGMAFFVFGKKQSRAGILVVGILLMIFPYFVSNIWAIAAIGTLLTLVPLVIRKYGPGM